MPPPTRTVKQRQDDRVRISELLLKGWSQKEIAKELGLTAFTVCRDIKVIERHRLMTAVKNLDAVRQRELAKIDRIEREAWDAWERSKEPFHSKKTKSVRNIATSLEKREEERSGDPRYLDIIMKCQQRRAELLGLNAPVRTELTGKDGQPIQHALRVDDMAALFKAIREHKEGQGGSG